jgi:hypothetical protein
MSICTQEECPTHKFFAIGEHDMRELSINARKFRNGFFTHRNSTPLEQ